jgi:hypothetical protein
LPTSFFQFHQRLGPTERLLHRLPTPIQVVKNLLAKRTAGAGDQRAAESWKNRH